MILRLIRTSLRQHALTTAVAVASIALSVGLLLTVWMVRVEARRAFLASTNTFDAVLGARGSKLQLVLNALYHMEASPGNLSAEDYAFIKKHPAIKRAIPIAVGDNLRGWRIVGTIPELFSQVEYQPGRTFGTGMSGRIFNEGTREAVLGSVAASALGLTVGDTFQPYHGIVFDERNRHDELYTIVGVLAASGTPADRAIWIPIAGVQTMAGHDPKAATDVSAVLIQLRTPAAGMMLDMMYNRQGNRLTFAYPVATVVAGLFDRLGAFEKVLELVSYLVAVVAAAAVLAGVHGTLASRRRDLAILRALGARRHTLGFLIVGEALVIGLLGAVAGTGLFILLFTGIAQLVRDQAGVILELARWNPALVAIPFAMTALAGAAGLLPAWIAYRSPVSENLHPEA